jgi:hypothetical protein
MRFETQSWGPLPARFEPVQPIGLPLSSGVLDTRRQRILVTRRSSQAIGLGSIAPVDSPLFGQIPARLPKHLRRIGPIAHQPSGFDFLANGVGRGNPVARRERRKLDAPAYKERVDGDEEGIRPIARQGNDSLHFLHCSSAGFLRTPLLHRHACGFKLANDGHDTRALQHYLLSGAKLMFSGLWSTVRGKSKPRRAERRGVESAPWLVAADAAFYSGRNEAAAASAAVAQLCSGHADLARTSRSKTS